MAAIATILSWAFALPAVAAVSSPVRQAPPAATTAHRAPAATPVATPVLSRAQQAVQRAERAASLQAQATRKPVVVQAETDTGTLVTANPNGSFTLTETSEPVRVKQGGTWVPINPALVKNADGTLRATATATGVTFSGGGTAPMATLTSGAKTLSFTFPATLPAPVISGPVATYRNVLPGVDLQLTANASGFSELLIVRTRAAAANPALRTMRLGMAARGVRVAASPDGGAQATDQAGAPVFHTDTATMWDSSPAAAAATGTAPATTATSAMSAASIAAAAPGHLARVAVRVGANSETLVPDASLLDSPKAAFPIYIDPAWSGNPSQLHWARISSNGWNIYDSTSTAGSDHPRSGFDGWPGGGNEIARTFYQMNAGGSTGTSGIGGADVTAATLSVVNNWAACSCSTAATIYLTGAPGGWSSSGLNWSNQPGAGAQQGSASSYETSSGTVSPGTMQFTVTGAAQSAAKNKWPNVTFVLKSNSESDRDYWKQYKSGGGATWSVTYYRAPTVTAISKATPTVSNPPVTSTDFVTSGSPTLKVTSTDSDGEQVRNEYQIYNGAETTQVGGDMYSGYSATGGSVTYGGTLGDGSYAWRARAENAADNEFSGWTAWQLFTVDTSVPSAPTVESAQFPASGVGGGFQDTGTFTITSNGDAAFGYLVSLDFDIGSTVWGGTYTTGSSGMTITSGKVYWIPATSGGYATVNLVPGATGPHTVYAKGVDEAGNTSGEDKDLFYAGTITPTIVGGDKLVNGYTAADGTVVPAGSYSNSGGGTGSLITQSDCCSIHWVDGAQLMLANNGGAVANGDSVTFSFEVPQLGFYDLGANLTKAHDYATYNLTLNANSATGTPAATLISGYDAYNSAVTTQYRDFGVPQDSNGKPIALPKGVYSVTLSVTGQDAASAGFQAGIDYLRISGTAPTCPITDPSNCYNNTAIAGQADIAKANADGGGKSYVAEELASAGWGSGASVTVNGAPITLPVYGGGNNDNMLSDGQTITFPSTAEGNAVEFLVSSTNGTVSGATGTVTYASTCNGKSFTQGFTLSTVPDWVTGPASAAAISFPNRNTSTTWEGDASHVRIYAISVPLACATDPVTSVTLPVQSYKLGGGWASLHVFALGIRQASFVAGSGGAQNWEATYAAKQDSHDGSLGQSTTIRMSAVTSVGGTSLRVHLSNALGSAPVAFDHVTVAQQSSGAIPATGSLTNVTFNGGSASVTIPAGGDATSDAVNLTTSQEQTLLVSVHTTGAVADTVGHADVRGSSWITSSTDTSNEAADTTGTPFTPTTDDFLYWLTGIDVTSAGNTNGSVGFYGDQTINSDTSNGAPNRFTDDVTSDLATANAGTVPYGVLNLGENNWGSTNNLIPVLTTSTAQLSAADPVDRDVIDQANIRTVLISNGTQDILNGKDATTVENELATLVTELKGYYSDTPGNNSKITVYVATIPPSSSFTAAQETVREAVNGFICGTDGPGGACGTSGSYLNGAADGYVDFAAATSEGTDLTATVPTDHLYNGSPNNAYYQAEAHAYVTATTLQIQPNIATRAAR